MHNRCFLGYTAGPPAPPSTDYPAPPLVSQAMILFVSACNMDANMQTWLGISNSTAGRALVVPQINTEVELDMGEYEWLRILSYLTSGHQNLQQAVAQANNDVANHHGGWLDNTGKQVPAQAWQVIGDAGNPNNRGAGIHF